MDRNKLHAPKRDFKIRGRGNFEVMSREDMKRHKIQDIIPSTKAKPVVEKPQAAAPVNNSRGVYIDAVKAPTLSSNTKVTIAPPKIDEVALEKSVVLSCIITSKETSNSLFFSPLFHFTYKTLVS